MEFTQTTFVDNPQYDQIVFTSNRGSTRVEISAFDKDDEVEFVVDNGESTTFFLTRENVQQLITHLQKQL